MARLICKQCGRPVTGDAVTALGAVWHREHFVCAACNLPIDATSFKVQDNKPYHSACYNENIAPRCAACGRPLTDRYVSADGKLYHDDCYRDFVVPRCIYCNEPLMGEYMVDHWGGRYCERHRHEYAACEFCGRLIPPAQQEHRDKKLNSTRCPICRSRAIETAEQARSAFTDVKRWVGSEGLTFNNLPISLQLCSRDYLAQHGEGNGQPYMLGVTVSTTHTLNGRETHTDVDGVAVLQGLPVPLFQGVVTHELGHVWLVAHGIKGLPRPLEEGFCELLAYRYYIHLDTPEGRFHSQRMEKNTDPVYGDGFRRVRTIAERVGFSQVLRTLQTSGRLPA